MCYLELCLAASLNDFKIMISFKSVMQSRTRWFSLSSEHFLNPSISVASYLSRQDQSNSTL